MKKIYVKAFIVYLLVVLFLTPTYTNAQELNGNEQISPMFSSILVINHKNNNIKLIDNIKVLMDIDKLVEEILMDE